MGKKKAGNKNKSATPKKGALTKGKKGSNGTVQIGIALQKKSPSIKSADKARSAKGNSSRSRPRNDIEAEYRELQERMSGKKSSRSNFQKAAKEKLAPGFSLAPASFVLPTKPAKPETSKQGPPSFVDEFMAPLYESENQAPIQHPKRASVTTDRPSNMYSILAQSQESETKISNFSLKPASFVFTPSSAPIQLTQNQNFPNDQDNIDPDL